MSELTPITRVESYLDAIVNNGIPPTEDITRIETFLQAIYDNQVCVLTPITRIEMFLGKISGQDIELPQPVTRAELYLAAIAGEDVELPENPITRIEMYLAEWADSGDWTTISGAIVEFVTTRAHKLKSCVVSLSPKQDLHGYDSPWPAGGGKNKWDFAHPVSTYNASVTENADGTFFVSGTTASAKLFYLVPVKQNQIYSIQLSKSNESGNTSIFGYGTIYDGSDDTATVLINSQNLISGKTFTPTGDHVYIAFQVTGGSGSGSATASVPIINEGSTTATYSPFSNICPISGWTGCEVYDTSENLFDVSTADIGCRLSTTGDAYREDGYYLSDFIPVEVGQTYTKNSPVIDAYHRMCTYNSSKSVVRTISDSNTVTIASGEAFVRFCGKLEEKDKAFFGTDYNSHSVTFGILGHNQWDEEWEVGGISSADGTPSSANAIRSKNFILVKPDTQYYWTFSVGNAPTQLRVHFYDRNQNWISSSSGSNIFTTPNNCHFIKFNTGTSFPSVYPSPTNGYISINYPSTFTSYEPYRDQVYGGNYDFVDGKGKDGMNEVNFDDLSWSLVSSTYGRWAATVSDIKAPTDGATLLNAVAEQYKIVTSNAYNNIAGTMYCVPNGTTINVCNGSVTDKPKGKLAYEIVTPTDFSATPTPITALKGYNAMWSNAGDIEVTVYGTPVEISTQQALNMLLGGAYRNNQTPDDVSDEEALDIILGGEQR